VKDACFDAAWRQDTPDGMTGKRRRIMATTGMPDAAAKVLGAKGKKLRPHEIHIRRTAEKGKFIAKHVLRDKDGNPPMDGQRSEAEYSLSSPQELMAHMQGHMGQDQEPDADDQEA
jgi:hypothetical protein